MQPASLITFVSFILELCNASPVYNMQPAFITTHIGTTGRNIRNLPCVSRKTNEKGICMFAINCLKANGTHLGTCIDKFYFGSCCQLPTVNEIDNTIDTDIIPSREPPYRLSTMKPVITTLIHSTSSDVESTTSTTTQKSTTLSTKEQTTTTESKLSTEFIIQNFTRLPSIAETSPEVETTTVAQKLSTFQSINGSPSTTITPRTTSKTTQITTRKPKPTITTTKSTSKPSTKPSTKPPSKPSKGTSRPRPTANTPKPLKTNKPTKSPTKRPVVTVKVPVSTKKPTTASTKPTKKPPTVTTKRPSASSTVELTTFKVENATVATTQKPTTLTTQKPEAVTISQKATTLISTSSPSTEQVTSNDVTVEVTSSPKPSTLSSTTHTPSFVTWTVDETTTKKNISEDIAGTITTTEDWRPITTPDGWVLLPSVKPATSSSDSPKDEIITTSSPKNNITTPQSESDTPSANVNVTTSSPPYDHTNSSSFLETTISTEEPSVTVSTSSPSTQQTFTGSTPEAVSTDSTEVTNTMNMSDFTSVCGRRMYPEARIVGGEKAPFGKWPWQISLRQWRTSTFLHKCGAALLNENWAITAAHCVDNVPPSDLLLRLGEHDLSTESEPYLHQERRVQIVASHPQFDPRTFEYDLALLRFYEPVTFQPNILPVCVPQSDENFVGRTAYVTGWGRLYEDGPLPSVLQEVSVPVVNNSVCESMYRSAGYIEHIPHIFICAGWRRGGFDSCEGDSGGPMVIQREDKRFLLAGVISWGIGCAEPNQPGVYTRISEFRHWINQILQF
ncbi:serine proteinase stubble [Harmonia axyridis]|uniref:serine proteinase stubble n=1 Tax=Harmonia axyridis TaxID=115357 RepID=UPI001E2752F7|nr:serine proteinase stubble [Harmonia axyridis]